MNKISVKYLEELEACEKGIDWFEENFGSEEYTIDELLNHVKENNIVPNYKAVRWFISKCELAQTQQMLDYYLLIDYYISLKPDYRDVSWFIITCNFARNNKELLEYIEKLLKRKKL